MDDQENEDKSLFNVDDKTYVDPVKEQEKEIKAEILRLSRKLLECPLVARVEVTFCDELEEYYDK